MAMELDDADRRAIAASFNQGGNVAGSGPGGTYTTADIGYDDPILLAQLNAPLYAGGVNYKPPVGYPTAQPTYYTPPITYVPNTAPVATDTWSPTTGLPDQTTGLCDSLPFPLNVACQAAGNYVGNKLTNTGGTTPGGSTGCPAGYHKSATGGCVIDGVGSYIPGDVGRPDYVWTPVNGAYGAGLTPVLVQRNTRACPPGHKLGKDGVCYRHISNKDRAHNPGHKPFLTGGEMHALQIAKRLRKKGRKLNSVLGVHPPRHAAAPRRKGK